MSQREDFKKALKKETLLTWQQVASVMVIYDRWHQEPSKAPESPAKASSFPVGPLPLLESLEARDAFFAAFPGIEQWLREQCKACGAMKHPNPTPGGPDYCPSCAYKAGTPPEVRSFEGDKEVTPQSVTIETRPVYACAFCKDTKIIQSLTGGDSKRCIYCAIC